MAYIDKEKALSICQKYYLHCLEMHDFSGDSIADDIQTDIQNLPTADVVEVVRCKDCKHYDIRNAKCLLHSEYADQYSSGFNFEMYSKDYCSYGELKEREG